MDDSVQTAVLTGHVKSASSKPQTFRLNCSVSDLVLTEEFICDDESTNAALGAVMSTCSKNIRPETSMLPAKSTAVVFPIDTTMS